MGVRGRLCRGRGVGGNVGENENGCAGTSVSREEGRTWDPRGAYTTLQLVHPQSYFPSLDLNYTTLHFRESFRKLDPILTVLLTPKLYTFSK